MKSEKVETVSFKKIVEEIPNTNYASHGMYYFPAQFIPQAVRFVINKYTDPENVVFDPFAGGGTVGIEAMITGRNSILWDLDPILELLMEAQILKCSESEKSSFLEKIQNMLGYNGEKFLPEWDNVDYWYPDKVLSVLEKWWGYFHSHNFKQKPLLRLALFKISNKFSWGDDQVPKLFKSKKKTKKLNKILEGNWKEKMRDILKKEGKKVFDKSVEFRKVSKNTYCKSVGGIDILDPEVQLDDDIDLLVTSPPYLQAHEYLRSTKLELYWSGYNDKEVRELKRSEIPYNDPPEVNISSETYEKYREKIDNEKSKLQEYYENYFRSMFISFEKFIGPLKKGGHMAVFIGNASVAGIDIPIHDIFKEHLTDKGLKYEKTYVDKIKSRKLFKQRKNLSPDGIAKENFLILKK